MRLGDMQFGQQKNLDPFKKNMDQKEEKDEKLYDLKYFLRELTSNRKNRKILMTQALT